MESTPQAIATTTFRVVKKGYDPDEVRAYLTEVARAVEASQAHAQAMEARARQAVAKANEFAAAGSPPAPSQATPAEPSADAGTISRTLLLAQRTADEAVATARAEADRMSADAHMESDRLLAEASGQAAKLVNDARNEARRVGDAEKSKVNEEVQQLLARLEFLKDDVAQMEAHVLANRQRVADVAVELQELAGRPVGGLGSIRRPMLSPASDELRADEVRAGADASASDASSADRSDGSAAEHAVAADTDVAPPTPDDQRRAETMAIPVIRRAAEALDPEPPPPPAPSAAAAFADDFFDDIAGDDDLAGEGGDVTAEVPVVQPPAAPPQARLTMKFIDDDSL